MIRFGGRRDEHPHPLADTEVLLLDLDGVIYRGSQPVPNAVETVNSIDAAGEQRIGYITNNASRTAAAVAAQLNSFGLHTSADSIVTSPQAAVKLLRTLVDAPATVLVVGGDGLTNELERAGYRVTRSADDDVRAVLQGFDPNVGWSDLAEASFALQRLRTPSGEELPWIATNTDWTLPLERGNAPGNGTLVSAVHVAVGRLATFAGKPETPIFETALERFGSRSALMVGDRLDTDVQGANAVGIRSALVLTGIDRPKQLIAASKPQRPTYILRDLRGLTEPYPLTEVLRDGTIRVGDAKVRMAANVTKILATGDDPLNLLRAGCEAVWRSGLAIYGLKVEPALYDDVF